MKNNTVTVGIGLIAFCVLAIALTGIWAFGPTSVLASNPLIRSQPTPEAPQVPACGPDWTVVTSPNLGAGNNYLQGVAAVSATDVWAVGDYADGTVYQTLIEHWNGSQWSLVTSPSLGSSNNYLTGVAAVSATDVWAVGDYFNGSAVQTLMEHWDGSQWSIVSSSNVGSSDNYLTGIAAVSATDVWAVGFCFNGTIFQTLIEHWDGSTWTLMSSPNVGSNKNFLTGVAAVSATDLWAVGGYSNGSADQTLIEHWDGSQWSIVSSPNVGPSGNYLTGIAGVSATDVWAVGYYNYNGSADQTLVERWDGSQWSLVSSPNVGPSGNYLHGIAAVSATDVWAIGDYDGSRAQTLAEHFNPCLPTATATDTRVPTGAPTNTPTNVPGTTITPPPSDTPGTPVTTPTSCPIQFTDVLPNSPFYSYIRCMACRGLVNGYSSGCESGNPCFHPANNVTRGQFAKIASNAAGFIDPPGAQQYEDVVPGSTFYDFIWRLASRGLVSGYPCGGAGEPCGPNNLPYFRPNSNITRGQIAKIDANAAGFNETPGAQQYEDVLPGSTFYDSIWRLTNRGLVNGYPCGGAGEPCGPGNLPYFRPAANATRGQASKIVSNTFFPSCQIP